MVNIWLIYGEYMVNIWLIMANNGYSWLLVAYSLVN